jgi:hypothetical protein
MTIKPAKAMTGGPGSGVARYEHAQEEDFHHRPGVHQLDVAEDIGRIRGNTPEP